MSKYAGNVNMAIQSLRAARWRSWLTMFGIIVGIVSAVTVVSIGEGIKHQISGQINHLGENILTIRPGTVSENNAPLQSLTDLINPSTNSVLTSNDLNVIQKVSNVSSVVPLSIVPGPIQIGSSNPNITVIGTNDAFPSVLNQTVEYGEFFNPNDVNPDVAVIGNNLATALFGTSAPLGQSFTFRGQQFDVVGVLNSFNTPPLSINADFNNAIFIPYQVADQLEQGTAPLYEVLAKVSSSPLTSVTKQNITVALKAAHGGVVDFSVLTQAQTLNVTSRVLNLLTDFIGAVAAISLLVGGIGIMNVMLVSVTERTHEIGIRKAIGATNKQIRSQFITEAVVLCIVAGLAAIIISLLINASLRVVTSLQPAISWQIMVLSMIVAVVVGIVFGSIPALKAAHKEPIDALRNE